MPRGRKLSPQQIESAAVDRRNGLSWRMLSEKYKVAINTIRYSLAEYSDEFAPTVTMLRPKLENQLNTAQADIEKIKEVLLKRFGISL